MTDESKAADQTADDGNVFDVLRDLQTAGFGSISMVGTAWVEAMSDLGSEVLSFVADRVKEDVHTQHEILHAKDVHELQNIQAKFVQKALDQYAAETGKLVKLGQSTLGKLPGAVILPD